MLVACFDGAAPVDRAEPGGASELLDASDVFAGSAPLTAWLPDTDWASCFGLVDALVRLPLLRAIDGTFRG